MSWILLLSALAAACGTAGPDDAALAEVAARWECDRQRFTYDSIEAIEAAETAAVTGAGVTLEQFEAFKVRLQTDTDLRNDVFSAYEAYCAVVPADEDA